MGENITILFRNDLKGMDVPVWELMHIASKFGTGQRWYYIAELLNLEYKKYTIEELKIHYRGELPSCFMDSSHDKEIAVQPEYLPTPNGWSDFMELLYNAIDEVSS